MKFALVGLTTLFMSVPWVNLEADAPPSEVLSLFDTIDKNLSALTPDSKEAAAFHQFETNCKSNWSGAMTASPDTYPGKVGIFQQLLQFYYKNRISFEPANLETLLAPPLTLRGGSFDPRQNPVLASGDVRIITAWFGLWTSLGTLKTLEDDSNLCVLNVARQFLRELQSENELHALSVTDFQAILYPWALLPPKLIDCADPMAAKFADADDRTRQLLATPGFPSHSRKDYYEAQFSSADMDINLALYAIVKARPDLLQPEIQSLIKLIQQQCDLLEKNPDALTHVQALAELEDINKLSDAFDHVMALSTWNDKAVPPEVPFTNDDQWRCLALDRIFGETTGIHSTLGSIFTTPPGEESLNNPLKNLKNAMAILIKLRTAGMGAGQDDDKNLIPLRKRLQHLQASVLSAANARGH